MKPFVALTLLLGCVACQAFSPAVTESAGVTVELPEQQPWTKLDTPIAVPVNVTNAGNQPLAGTVEIGLTDAWSVAGPPTQAVTVAPNKTATLTFAIQCGEGTYAAFYPIHATFDGQRGGQKIKVHAVLVVEARPPASAADRRTDPLVVDQGVTPLARVEPDAIQITRFEGQSYALPFGTNSDPETRGNWSTGVAMTRGDARDCIGFHPPWYNNLKGQVSGIYRLQLPNSKPIRFEAGLAIRDNGPTEPPSDGVTFIVQVTPPGGQPKTLAEKHTVAKVWDELSVDLSAYAGQTITLTLTGDPGPKRDTSCDSSYWGGPLIRVGEPLPKEPAAANHARAEQALTQARAARGGDAKAGWLVKSAAGTTGVAVVPGPRGMTDAQIAFSAAKGEVVFDGFEVQIDGFDLADITLPDPNPAAQPVNGKHRVMAMMHGQKIAVEASLLAADGAFKIGWSMPGVKRDRRGEPRFSRLGMGAANADTLRVYFGHGHVVEGSPKLTMGYGGFSLSTRYMGVEYTNGLALVSASDPVPDRLEHDQALRKTTLIAHHDATFAFVPSEQGAFAAARVWRLQSGLKASPDVAAIRGKMCIDQWGGDYGEAAEGLRLATAYGLDDAVFVKHVWQRWGYDYRLPDIYPPAGNRADFDAMVEAAKLNGRLFALHDNYIDLYPDADDFSFDLIGFQANGQPRKAWFNTGREAQSYKWHPDKFLPFLDRNLPIIEQNIGPSAYFIDVWSAAGGVDQYDREGNFSSKMDDLDSRAKGFDKVREMLGCPTISEAGHDGLVGSLAAAQADHLTMTPEGGKHIIKADFKQWDRVPWFDMGHHGQFILFAGGLGGRYQAERPTALHGYGSDDYLTCTILGGRTPMCDGPFSRRTVNTYWLLQPICNELEMEDLLAHRFVGDTVHRQEVTWSKGKVSVNRGPTDWTVDGRVLPEFGFIAKAGDHAADITRRDGILSASSSAPGVFFADARPPDSFEGLIKDVVANMDSFQQTAPRHYQMTLHLDVREPLSESVRLFVHMTGEAEQLPDWEENSDILFQATNDLPAGALAKVGRYDVTVQGDLPEKLLPGDIWVQYGLYDPAKGGPRLAIRAEPAWGGRYDGGLIAIQGTGPDTKMTWRAKGPSSTAERENGARKILDFGPLQTNSACRLLYGQQPWKLLMMPGSASATVILKLDPLGAKGKQIASLEELTVEGQVKGPGQFRQQGDTVVISTGVQPYGYRITVK